MTHEHSETHPPETDGIVLRWAWFYDPLVRVASLGRERKVRQQTAALAELRPGLRVLEVGCGTGTLSIAAAQAATDVSVLGIDPAPAMIERARRKAAAAGVEAEFKVGIVEKLEVEDASVDVVLSSLMLHHLPEATQGAGLLEILRVLAPGGRLVVVDFPGPGPLMHRLGRWLRPGRVSAKRHIDQVQDGVREAGFIELVLGRIEPGPLFSLVATKPR